MKGEKQNDKTKEIDKKLYENVKKAIQIFGTTQDKEMLEKTKEKYER